MGHFGPKNGRALPVLQHIFLVISVKLRLINTIWTGSYIILMIDSKEHYPNN